MAGRGGQGIANIEMSSRNGPAVAAFPVANDDHLVLVTDGGQIIRVQVSEINIMGRRTQGVTLFKLSNGERVVSVSRLREDDGNGKTAGNGKDNGKGNGIGDGSAIAKGNGADSGGEA